VLPVRCAFSRPPRERGLDFSPQPRISSSCTSTSGKLVFSENTALLKNHSTFVIMHRSFKVESTKGCAGIYNTKSSRLWNWLLMRPWLLFRRLVFCHVNWPWVKTFSWLFSVCWAVCGSSTMPPERGWPIFKSTSFSASNVTPFACDFDSAYIWLRCTSACSVAKCSCKTVFPVETIEVCTFQAPQCSEQGVLAQFQILYEVILCLVITVVRNRSKVFSPVVLSKSVIQ